MTEVTIIPSKSEEKPNPNFVPPPTVGANNARTGYIGKMDELKPCPFCGHEAIILPSGFRNKKGYVKIVCQYCHSGQGSYKRWWEAVEMWNRRIDNGN